MEVAEANFREVRENKPPLGAKNILKQRPTDKPRNPSFLPRIKMFGLNKQERFDWLESFRNFVGSYREVFDGFKKGRCQTQTSDG